MDKADINELKRTSSLNKYFICHYCDKQTTTKRRLFKHILLCVSDRTCSLCNIVFKNRGNLVTHEFYIHEIQKAKHVRNEIICTICGISFTNNTCLKYHNRKAHYNLITKLPLAFQKDINNTWYEKVINTNSIIELTKVSHNVLLLRKYVEDHPVLVEESTDVLNLSVFYPTAKSHLTKCDICNVQVAIQDFRKHYRTAHQETNILVCDYCKASFRQAHFFAKHKCVKTKRNNSLPLHISKVENLSAIAV